MSLAWTGLIPEPHRGRDPRPQPRDGLRRSSARRRRSFAVPAQNLVYADRQGHIGYQAPGPGAGPAARPARATRPGYWPAPGLGLDLRLAGVRRLLRDCRGPSTPRTASIVTANQPVTRSSTPFLTADWDQGWRSTRIGERLAGLRQGHARPTWPRSSWTPRTPSPRCSSRRCSRCRSRPPRPTPTPASCSSSPARRASCCAAGTARPRPATRRPVRPRRTTTPSGATCVELLFDDELPGRAQGRRRCAGGAPPSQQLLTNPEQRLVGQQAHPQRHRGQGRDPAPGARRGPARADPRARQGPGPVAVGQAAPAHPRAPRCSAARPCRAPVRWLVNEGPFDMPGGSAIVNANALERERGLRGDRGAVDADGRRPRRTSTRRRGSTRPGSAGTRPTTHYADQVDDWVGGSSAAVAVHRGRRAGHRPRRAHPPAGGAAATG